jgi:hypothetical protein
VELPHGCAADEHRDVAVHGRGHVQQVDFERLTKLDETDHVGHGAKCIHRAVDGQQPMHMIDLRPIGLESRGDRRCGSGDLPCWAKVLQRRATRAARTTGDHVPA